MITKNQIWKLYGTQYKEMTKELLFKTELADLIGDRKARIGIKPNLVVPSPAEYGGTTHPEVVAGIVEYLQENQFDNITIVEGSWVGDRTSDAYKYCGYKELCEKYGVPFVDGQKQRWHAVDCAGMKLNVIDFVDKIDFLINVPVVKGHCQTKMTCALKNLKGLLPDFEEGGNPVVRNCVMAALDPVLVDSYACSLLQYTPDEVPYVRMAEKLGVGTADLSSAQIIDLGGFRGYAGKEMQEDRPRKHKLLDVSYAVDEVDSCSACYASLVGALWRLKEDGLLEKLDTPIGIGQGMQGRTGKLGVGKCTKDFDVCIMGCPPEEDKIYEELKAYILKN